MIRVGDTEKQLFDRTSATKGLATASWARMQLLASVQGEPLKGEENRRNDLRLLSLFCGPGGLDEGFHQGGFATDLAFDIDQECVNTFQLNHRDAKAYVRDITKLTIEELDQLHGKKFTPCGVIGGPPCQSFSVSNVHQTDDDPRHLLPEAYAKLLKQLNERHPLSFFVFENVPGLLGKKHRERYEKFKRLFAQAGFEINEHLFDAQHYGVPQERPRIIIVGINTRLHPNTRWAVPEPENRIRTVRQTIGNLGKPLFRSDDVNPEDNKIHPNHVCLEPKSKKFTKVGMLTEGQMWGRSFRTLYWDKPSWTVAYGHREVHVHPSGTRRLSIYEAMLLQSFPKNYRLTGNISAQIRLVSEAVPPRLGWHVAVSIRRALGL